MTYYQEFADKGDLIYISMKLNIPKSEKEHFVSAIIDRELFLSQDEADIKIVKRILYDSVKVIKDLIK